MPYRTVLYALELAVTLSAEQSGMPLEFGREIVMLAKTKQVYKWEHAVISNMDFGGCVWARIRARGNREYSVMTTVGKTECYGTDYYVIKDHVYIS